MTRSEIGLVYIHITSWHPKREGEQMERGGLRARSLQSVCKGSVELPIRPLDVFTQISSVNVEIIEPSVNLLKSLPSFHNH